MATTRFIVVRHGETAWNAQGRIQGHLDSPLNEEGMAQAQLLAERLAVDPFDQFYVSDLGRARQTAQPVADRIGRQPVVTERLRERCLGCFQGLTGAECARTYPDDYRRFRSREPEHAMPGGESTRDLFARVSRQFEIWAEQHAGARVLVITHGGVLDVLYRYVSRVPLEAERDYPLFNASLNTIRHADGAWVMEAWGDIAHLTRDAARDEF